MLAETNPKTKPGSPLESHLTKNEPENELGHAGENI